MPLSDNTHIYYPGTHTYSNYHFSPDYIQQNPVELEIVSMEGKFPPLKNENLKKNTVKLTQELCTERYFIYGGFNASQLTFECYSEIMEDIAPEGKVRFYITPTVYIDGERVSTIDEEKTALFTGYIDRAEPSDIPGMWKVTAYDALYRVRNLDAGWLIQALIDGSSEPITWSQVKNEVERYISVPVLTPTPAWMNYILYPTNREKINVGAIDILREFALTMCAFGMIDGEGDLVYVHVDNWNDSYEHDSYRCVNLFDPHNLEYSDGPIWRPHLFTADPQTNKFVTPTVETPDNIDSYNIYTIKSSSILGDEEWIDNLYACDEYGNPNHIYNADNLPYGIFDTEQLNHAPNDIYECQEYSVRAAMDPTIAMGTQLFVYKLTSGAETEWKQLVRSYLMKRTINFISGELIECECSAENSSYNAEKYDFDSGIDAATKIANRARRMLPVLAKPDVPGGDTYTIEPLRAIKPMSRAQYDALSEKRADTLYYIIDDECIGGTGGTA